MGGISEHGMQISWPVRRRGAKSVGERSGAGLGRTNKRGGIMRYLLVCSYICLKIEKLRETYSRGEKCTTATPSLIPFKKEEQLLPTPCPHCAGKDSFLIHVKHFFPSEWRRKFIRCEG